MNHVLLYFNILKILHVISASILFGTGMGTALYMMFAHRQNDLTLRAKAYAQVVFADWIFTTPSAIFQAISGGLMIFIQGYYLHEANYQWHAWWVQGSVYAYLIAGACWLPVLYLQSSMQSIVQRAAEKSEPLPPRYYLYFRSWFALGIPAFLGLSYVFYLMGAQPLVFW